MLIWWHRLWNTESEPKNQQLFDTDASIQQSHIEDNNGDDDQKHRRLTKITHPHLSSPPHHHHHHHHQLSYSVHNCANQSKCVRTARTDHSSRMNSFCLAIIFIHCLNVAVLAIASENSNNSQPQPCDRSRRVFTDIQGEISNGPPGYNYTQVSHLLFYEPIFNCSLRL